MKTLAFHYLNRLQSISHILEIYNFFLVSHMQFWHFGGTMHVEIAYNLYIAIDVYILLLLSYCRVASYMCMIQ